MILRTGNRKIQGSGFRVQASEKKLTTGLWPPSTNKGLTLIEVLLAVAILGIGTISVLRAYASSISVLEAGQATIDATNLAKQKMAEVEQLILEEEQTPTGGERGTFEEPFTDYAWEWNIGSTETEDLKLLSLVVSNQNDPRTITFNTYVAEKESEEEQ